MKAGVARARDEGKHIDQPFREINWRKVGVYWAKGGYRGRPFRFRGDGMDIPYNALACGEGAESGTFTRCILYDNPPAYT